jgi:hypothetical protein
MNQAADYLDKDVHESSETHSGRGVHLEELGHVEEDLAFFGIGELFSLKHGLPKI